MPKCEICEKETGNEYYEEDVETFIKIRGSNLPKLNTKRKAYCQEHGSHINFTRKVIILPDQFPATIFPPENKDLSDLRNAKVAILDPELEDYMKRKTGLSQERWDRLKQEATQLLEIQKQQQSGQIKRGQYEVVIINE